MGAACTKCAKGSDVVHDKTAGRDEKSNAEGNPNENNNESIAMVTIGPNVQVVVRSAGSQPRSVAEASSERTEEAHCSPVAASVCRYPVDGSSQTGGRRQLSDEVASTSPSFSAEVINIEQSSRRGSMCSSTSRGVMSPAREISCISVVADDEVTEYNVDQLEEYDIVNSTKELQQSLTGMSASAQLNSTSSGSAACHVGHPSCVSSSGSQHCRRANGPNAQRGNESSVSIATPMHVEVTQTRRVDPHSLTGNSIVGEAYVPDAEANRGCSGVFIAADVGNKQPSLEGCSDLSPAGQAENGTDGVERNAAPVTQQLSSEEPISIEAEKQQQYANGTDVPHSRLAKMDPSPRDTLVRTGDDINCSTLSASACTAASLTGDETINAVLLSQISGQHRQTAGRVLCSPALLYPSKEYDAPTLLNPANVIVRRGVSAPPDISEMTRDDQSDVSVYTMINDKHQVTKGSDPSTYPHQPPLRRSFSPTDNHMGITYSGLSSSPDKADASCAAKGWPGSSSVAGTDSCVHTTSELLNMLRDMVHKHDERRQLQQQQHQYSGFTRIRNPIPLTSPDAMDDNGDALSDDEKQRYDSPRSGNRWYERSPQSSDYMSRTLTLPHKLLFSPISKSGYPITVDEEECSQGSVGHHLTMRER